MNQTAPVSSLKAKRQDASSLATASAALQHTVVSDPYKKKKIAKMYKSDYESKMKNYNDNLNL